MHWKFMLMTVALCSVAFGMMLSTVMTAIAAGDTVRTVIGTAGVLFNGFFVGIYWLILARGKWRR